MGKNRKSIKSFVRKNEKTLTLMSSESFSSKNSVSTESISSMDNIADDVKYGNLQCDADDLTNLTKLAEQREKEKKRLEEMERVKKEVSDYWGSRSHNSLPPSPHKITKVPSTILNSSNLTEDSCIVHRRRRCAEPPVEIDTNVEPKIDRVVHFEPTTKKSKFGRSITPRILRQKPKMARRSVSLSKLWGKK